GDGTFQAQRTCDTGAFYSVAAADVNGDGKIDLISPTYFGVSVVLGNGDGTFQAPRTFQTYQPSESVAVADINADGIPDLLVGDSTLSVLLGTGNGTFQPQQIFGSSGGAIA